MKKKTSHKGKTALGVGLALAAAGLLFFYGKRGAENRKRAKGWALKARKEVLAQLKRLPKIDRRAYNKAIDQVARRYRTLKNVGGKELAQTVRELKSHWSVIRREMKASAKKK